MTRLVAECPPQETRSILVFDDMGGGRAARDNQVTIGSDNHSVMAARS